MNSVVNKVCGQRDGPAADSHGMNQGAHSVCTEDIQKPIRLSNVSIMVNLIPSTNTLIVFVGSHLCGRSLVRREKMEMMKAAYITVDTSDTKMSKLKKVSGLVVNQKKEMVRVALKININTLTGQMKKLKNTSLIDPLKTPPSLTSTIRLVQTSNCMVVSVATSAPLKLTFLRIP